MNELSPHDPFSGLTNKGKSSLQNEDKIIKELAREHGFSSSPILHNSAIKKTITLMKDITENMKATSRECEDLFDSETRDSDSEIIRTALRLFFEKELHAQYQAVQKNRIAEGK